MELTLLKLTIKIELNSQEVQRHLPRVMLPLAKHLQNNLIKNKVPSHPQEYQQHRLPPVLSMDYYSQVLAEVPRPSSVISSFAQPLGTRSSLKTS